MVAGAALCSLISVPALAMPMSNLAAAASDLALGQSVRYVHHHYRYRFIDLSQPAMQVQIRSHIARYLRDFPQSGEGVITLAGVEHCFVYTVHDDVVDTVIGPPDYIEQILSGLGREWGKRRSARRRGPNKITARSTLENSAPIGRQTWTIGRSGRGLCRERQKNGGSAGHIGSSAPSLARTTQQPNGGGDRS
jgi:hypothetical protein